jgi:uncharacterized protein YyaL (SSP411 family)
MNNETNVEHTNRLVHETSPYLLQHAHNPVDWYPWGPEAFERARSEDKPILLSVGYSACHWCHRMREESFENEDTARLMNERFVSIKVDREERPDVDALYMDAVQALTGGGGWPMTVFLTPDGAPFYGGTYFPPADRYGMPGFPRLLRSIADLYQNRREEVDRQAEEFRRFYRERGEVRVDIPPDIIPAEAVVDPAVLAEAATQLIAQFDTTNGGFGRAPKFPHPMALEFLLRMQSRAAVPPPTGASTMEPDLRLLPLVRLTLDRMADGGIYDQIGGGFHRYSTDERWLVPHFEKMLYDNALLAPTYLHAWQITGDERYRRICEQTLDYVLREMTDPEGGFYSTQDADSEGEEGKFYVWTPQELRDILGDADAAIVEQVWGVTEQGNFEGKNILHVAQPVDEVASSLGVSEASVRATVERACERLYAARTGRTWPGRDDKVLAAWNGLMLRAMAEAGRALDRDHFRQAALRNAAFLRTHMLVDGRLRRSWRQGTARLDAYLEDEGAIANGLLSAYEATGDAALFTDARALVDDLMERFWDEEAGGFFDTARDHEALIGRPRELTDNAVPSGTSLATEALLRLAALTGEQRYRDRAARVLLPLASAMAQQPSAFGHLLCALDDFIGPYYEIALVGTGNGLTTLAHAVSSRYLPRAVTAIAHPDAPSAAAAVPLLEGRDPIDGHATAYVCHGFVCRQPVTSADDLPRVLPG